MPRRLPWKEYPKTTSRLSNSVEDLNDQTSNRGSQRQRRSSTDRATRSKKPDHTEDWTWRMTESELVATAQLYTADMHEQAYRKLLDRQTRDAERLTTIDNLLDQPLVQQPLPVLPPKSKSNPKISGSISGISGLPALRQAKKPQIVESESKAIEPITKSSATIISTAVLTEPEEPAERSLSTNKDSWHQRPTIKPTAAALARKRRRLQAEQASDDVVTFL